MNCTGFERVVVEMARGGLTDAAAQREAAAHAKTCARCARRLAHEQSLSAVVATVVMEDSQRVAPAAVEQILLAEFRKQHARSKRQGAWRARAAVGAVAAALIVAAAVSLRRAPEQNTVQMKPPEAHVTPLVRPVVAPAVREVSKPRVRTLRASQPKVQRKPATEPVLAQREVMTEFIPIVYDPEPIERGQIVRIRLPRSALATFGIPMNEEHAEEAIRADVLLGEDGLARAVRFVK
jgi:hypothetical protein